jgi:hypothetical protein
MDIHTASFMHDDRKGPNYANPWEVASVDTWSDAYSFGRADQSIEDANAAKSLTEGLVTTFLNHQMWTLRAGKPARVLFDRLKFLANQG